MPVFENSVPAVPDNIGNYIIVRNDVSNIYYLYPNVSDAYATKMSGGYDALIIKGSSVAPGGVYYYTCVNNSWQPNINNSSFTGGSEYHVENAVIMYSSYDINYTDGKPFYYTGVSQYGQVMNDSISSSTINNSLREQVLPVVGIVVVAVVGFFGFRKAWRFLTGLVRGA